ncbi:MAG: hypothetical protein ACXADO_05090 [Candidatus Thorarchaeota archaeon]
MDSEVRSTAPNAMPDGIKNVLYWTKLLTGMIFGTLSYFIMRFYQVLTRVPRRGAKMGTGLW